MKKFNRDFFDIIDTEEKAYWLGFITADGNVDTKRNILYINLAIKDIDHLYKLKSHLSSEHIIYEKISNFNTGVCSLQICNGKLKSDLIKHGIEPKKSHTIKANDNISEDLKRHYWRGIFDGDGCIYINKRNQMSVSLNGNTNIVQSFKDFLIMNDIHRGSIQPHSRIFKFKTVGKEAPNKIARLLYEDSNVHLDRKFNVFRKYTF